MGEAEFIIHLLMVIPASIVIASFVNYIGEDKDD